jgi:hypothetical protein
VLRAHVRIMSGPIFALERLRRTAPGKLAQGAGAAATAGATAIAIAFAVHADVLGVALGAIAAIITVVLALCAVLLYAAGLHHKRFLHVTQDDAKYMQWEREVLARLYPDAVFRLGALDYVALIKHAPRPIEHTGHNALRFPELARLTDPRVQAEESYSRGARSYLAYATRDDVKIIRYPQRLGYVPLSWNSGGAIALGVARFGDMIATGIDLQRELYDQYIRRVSAAGVVLKRREELGLLDGHIPVSKTGFRPVLSVQALTIIVNDGVPQVLVMERSNKVAFRQGWWQFPPSGAMEVFGDIAEDDEDELEKHSDPGASLRREFIEELFGIDELQAAEDDTFENLEVSPDGRKLSDAFACGAAKAIFMGVVADAVGLRGELCFLIVARDVAWEFKKGIEANKKLTQKTFDALANLLARPNAKINPTSAALLRLAIDGGHLSREGLISMEKAVELFGGTGGTAALGPLAARS